MEKKDWKTPELTILAHSHPEEAVLTGCKTASGMGPGMGFDYCNEVSGCFGSCNAVSAS